MKNERRRRRSTIITKITLLLVFSQSLVDGVTFVDHASFVAVSPPPTSSSSSAAAAAASTSIPISNNMKQQIKKNKSVPNNNEISENVSEEEKQQIPAKEEEGNIRDKLLNLLPKITGKEEEYKSVQNYVNELESKWEMFRTLDFANFANAGEWQLLFSTKLLKTPSRKLRLRELIQRIEPDGLQGNLTNLVRWDLAQDDDNNFSAYGILTVKCPYKIEPGTARLSITQERPKHVIELSRGSIIPKDVEQLVGLIRRAMPTEMFDPFGLVLDSTFVDPEMRIVRYSHDGGGGRGVHEGVRNIFVRKGMVEIRPVEE